MRKNNLKRLVFAALLLFGVAALNLYFFYFKMLKKEEEAKRYAIKEEVSRLQTILDRTIDDKQKALNAIALALEFDSNITKRVAAGKIPENYAVSLMQQLRRFSNYKNIWMQLYDKKGRMLFYQSWVKEQDGAGEIVRMPFPKRRIVDYIDVDVYDLCINSLLKLQDERGEGVGALNLKAHFNSISAELTKYGIDSVVVVDKTYRTRLSQPFTNKFIGDYYIANLDASKEKLDFLKNLGVDRLMRPGYLVIGEQIVLSYPLKNREGRSIAYYILFENAASIVAKLEEKTFIEAMKIAFVTLFFVILAVFSYEAYLNRAQKRYYRSIIDHSRNVIVITDGRQIIDVNEMFLEYFGVDSLKAFVNSKKRCLRDYFVKEEGYLDIDEAGEKWFEYVYRNPNKKYKAKLDIEGKIYYFLVSVSKVKADEMLYSIVMADITTEENYRRKLEKTAVTDPLTGIYNRGFFQERLKEELLFAQRYSRPLSLMVMDIDHFKKINDKFGHDVGDRVLVEIAQLISEQIRPSDIFCRIGGEEFAIILRETSLKDAVRAAKKINRLIRENKKMLVPVTVSIGVVEYIKGESEADIYKRADYALYKAKTSGRDRVVIG